MYFKSREKGKVRLLWSAKGMRERNKVSKSLNSRKKTSRTHDLRNEVFHFFSFHFTAENRTTVKS